MHRKDDDLIDSLGDFLMLFTASPQIETYNIIYKTFKRKQQDKQDIKEVHEVQF